MAVPGVERAREETAEPEPAHPEPATDEAEQPASGVSTAGYLVFRNHGPQPDRLLSVETDAARSVEVHRTVMEGDIMRMRPVRDLSIPAGGSVELEPGGLHLMLRDLRRTLPDDARLTFIFRFERAGEVVAELVVGRGFQR
jgi:copper(I)-binding protein